MPSSVELCFLDMAFMAPEANARLTRIHVFGVPGFRRTNGQTVISPNVQTFLKDFITDRLFRHSQFSSRGSFNALNLWLYDSTLPPEARTYEMPAVDQAGLTLTSETPMSRLKAVHVFSPGLPTDDDWQTAVRGLFGSLFVEFINMSNVPLYFIKFPILDQGPRPTSEINLYPDSSKSLLFDSILVETLVSDKGCVKIKI
ncbi:MAG: hypothetical protein AAGC54_19810 [Cyanobacteria bacterium P01_F01_bin.4]